MPTGYTAEIAKGISFEQYALNCARAFGALIKMRDDPHDAPIPDEIKPSTYHAERLNEEKQSMENLLAAGPKELAAMAKLKYDKELEYYNSSNKEKAELLDKYNAMLEKAKNYTPPTDQHVGYAEFLVSQIEESIKWDCGLYGEVPKLLPAKMYKKQELDRLSQSILYHKDGMEKEIERARDRTEWIRQLKKSLIAYSPQPI